jgi:hypothetical protein
MLTILRTSSFVALESSRDRLRRPGGLISALLLLAVVVIPNAFTAWTLGRAATSADFQSLRQQQLRIVGKSYGDEVAQMVQAAPSTLGMAALTLLLVIPAAALVMASGMLDPDRRGSLLNFEVARMPRAAVVAARAIGLWLALALMAAATLSLVAILVLVFDARSAFPPVAQWTLRLSAVCAASALAYVSLATFVNVLVPRAGPALGVGAVVFVCLLIVRSWSGWDRALLPWFFPGANDAFLLSFEAGTAAWAALRTALWGLAVATAAALVFWRRPA